ncbi:MAG: response regulator transcription factor [Actinomycetota bacterium]|nr:response regulator transcription factor [Actinomycetota bacterium]
MHAPAPITVVVARFEDLLARGLQGVIEGDPSLEIVADDVEPDRIGVILRAHRPRVAILDVDALPALVEVSQLSRGYPDTRLVLLATDPNTAVCAQLLAFGASACLGRRTQARDVLTAIHLASRGLQLTPLASPASAAAPRPGFQLLTPREAEVLPLLQQGSSNAEIAAALHVAVETVRTHARNIYRKLGVSSRRELAPPSHRAPVEEADPPPPPAARRWAAPTRDRQRRPGSVHR